MKKSILTAILLAAFTYAQLYAETPITLEHRFDGNYSPYNFPIVYGSDNDRFFLGYPQFDEATMTFSTQTYNEDYTIHNTINVTLKDFPADYKISKVSYHPYIKLPDGTPIIIVDAISTTISLGQPGYAGCWLYNADNGQMIVNLGYASQYASALNTVYEINGKNSIVVMFANYLSGKTTYETSIYSLGESSESQIVEPGINVLPYPVEVYDINGRVITTYRQNAPEVKIIRMSDGSVNKTLN